MKNELPAPRMEFLPDEGLARGVYKSGRFSLNDLVEKHSPDTVTLYGFSGTVTFSYDAHEGAYQVEGEVLDEQGHKSKHSGFLAQDVEFDLTSGRGSTIVLQSESPYRAAARHVHTPSDSFKFRGWIEGI